MKIGTWNVNSLRVRLTQVLRWLDMNRPDVLALQETKMEDRDFPVSEFERAGYHAAFSGQPTYNGVALLSREPPEVIATALPDFEDAQKRVLLAKYGNLAVLDLYVPNGQTLDSDKYRYKLDWLAQLDIWLEQLLREHPELVMLGDFNIAPEDRDVYDPKAWEGQVLVSEPERAAFRKLLAHGLRDSFRLHTDGPGHYSWWDFRTAAFRRNQGLRIDHILLSPALAERSAATVIDREPRGWERPSDHTPVIAELNAP
ncbi:MAG TPA: exodeoxyribonuclease III [Gammaproteobacteria bacterium]|nr:exodeoxyribonuclease III [Gammaproteobacteria bacterium]